MKLTLESLFLFLFFQASGVFLSSQLSCQSDKICPIKSIIFMQYLEPIRIYVLKVFFEKNNFYFIILNYFFKYF